LLNKPVKPSHWHIGNYCIQSIIVSFETEFVYFKCILSVITEVKCSNLDIGNVKCILQAVFCFA